METLRKRLVPDTYAELAYMIRMFDEGGMPVYPAGMAEHFHVAKEKPDAFRNHSTVLAISLGGTNTKIMLASMREGRLWAEYVRALENPEQETSFYDYLDDLILHDEVIDHYLRTAQMPCIGVSLPMTIVKNCPYHVTKLPTIVGLAARSPEQCTPEMEFDANFARYLKSRGYTRPVRLFYQSDGIVAHHGAVSLYDMDVRDKSVLCICGTGMANGDERSYLPIALLCNLAKDDDLYPPQETENRQLNYAIAGKGVFSLMRRAVETRARMPGSALAGKSLERFFLDPRATRTVFEVWQTMLEPGFETPRTQEIREAAGQAAFAELQQLADMIATRDYETLANTILSTLVSMGVPEEGGCNILFFEGSIACNPALNQRLQRNIREKAANQAFFAEIGKPMHTDIRMDTPLKPVMAAQDGIPLQAIDTTLIGTATMIMACTLEQ